MKNIIHIALYGIAVFLGASISALQLVLPIEGEMNQDWIILNYVDLDASSGISDFRGGPYSYDGHKAIDFSIPSFRSMDAGVKVFAAADGVVVSMHDGEFDRHTVATGEPSNYVTIDHGGGWYAYYSHFRKNTILVNIGQQVTEGEVLGMVGSSGNSSRPHLHFQLSHNGDIVCPFQADMWKEALPYAGDARDVIDSGMLNFFLGGQLEIQAEGPPKKLFFLPGERASHWIQVSSFDPSDSFEWNFYRPDGTTFVNTPWQSTWFSRGAYVNFGYYLPSNVYGKWRSTVHLNGELVSSLNFYVSPNIDTDNDSIPDSAEIFPLENGKDDMNFDYDGDGVSNAKELLMGSSPTAADSTPLASISWRDDSVVVNYKAFPGRVAYFERSTDISTNQWTPMNYLNTSKEKAKSFKESDFEASAFYRIRIEY